MFKNLARAGLAGLAALVFSAAGSAAPPLKVGFVYVSPIGEAGWTYQHELGRREMVKTLGDQVTTTVVEGVAEGADSERVMRDLAAQGCGLIFATSFGYLEPALRVGADYPQLRIEQAGGYKTAANVDTYNARYYEARYLAGLVAGKASRSGIAGYVAGFPVPEVVQGINAFALGMREVNPKAVVKVVWLDTWFDPAREREAALTLINQGADVLANHSGSPAVPQAAQAAFKDRHVRVISYQSDMRAYAPDAQLAAITTHWGGYYTRVARSVVAGTWKPQPVWGGIADGMVDLSALAADVPADAKRLVAERRQAIVDGRFRPFHAPLVDNEGKTRLASGALDDKAIGTMDWFVRGVAGAVH
ncbi:MAG: BMP family ABC transporter substrate-binding protein [Proteobacteria bacterium]|nr:BMP family ABC transporter substrate-binding protein [Pseudomonadota bacterium]